jgi:DNA-binding beta-propeller fold protein YncE
MPLLALTLLLAGPAALRPADTGAGKSVSLPNGEKGIGFDDLRFSRRLHRVLVPSGRTGLLALVDPVTLAIESIPGFSAKAAFAGGHGEGITSVDEGDGRLFVADRTSRRLLVVDPDSKKILSGVPLSSSPDYVRWVPPTREIWVTEPDEDRIEVFRAAEPPEPAGSIPVPGGPESLVVDSERARAYTHLWSGTTLAFDVRHRAEAARWENGCRGSRGIALDPGGGRLFAGCAEGRAVSLETSSGRILDRFDSGDGVDIIDYDPNLRHLYLPGGKSATMAILEVSTDGKFRLARTVPTASGAHCVVSDGAGHVFVCDPKKGRLLVFEDGAAPPR